MTEQRRYLILFDVDGTLIASGTVAHHEAFGRVWREVYGVDAPAPGAEVAGQTDRQIVCGELRRRGVAEARIQHLLPQAFRLIDEHVAENSRDGGIRILEGIHDLFALLRDRHHLGLITGNLPGVARTKLSVIGLLDAVEVGGELVGGFGDLSENRADLVRAGITTASRLYATEFTAQMTVVVGDTPNDIRAAREAGARCVAVATGPHRQTELAAADLVVASFADAAAAAAALTGLFV